MLRTYSTSIHHAIAPKSFWKRLVILIARELSVTFTRSYASHIWRPFKNTNNEKKHNLTLNPQSRAFSEQTVKISKLFLILIFKFCVNPFGTSLSWSQWTTERSRLHFLCFNDVATRRKLLVIFVFCFLKIKDLWKLKLSLRFSSQLWNRYLFPK